MTQVLTDPIPATLKKLSLEATAVQSALLPLVGVHRTEWTGDDNLRLVESVMDRLRTEDGETPGFSQEFRDIVRLVFRPNEAIQKKVLQHFLAKEGFTLDDRSKQALFMLLSSAQFAEFLATTNNPKTGVPYIRKEKKRGAKKQAFASLVAGGEPIIGTEEYPEDYEEKETDDGRGEEVEVEVPAAPVKPSKPAPRRV